MSEYFEIIKTYFKDLYPEGMIIARDSEKEGLNMNKCKTCAHNLVCCHLSDTDSDFYAHHGYHYDFENCPHYKDNDNSPIRFILNGCDIFFKAVAPADITLKQLLKQCDRIKPDYCACGIKSDDMPSFPVELTIMYDSMTKVDEVAECTILPEVSK